ncbi:MAG: hypothetical protein JSV49_03190 [Thermoplasmata archaeon]|nr:MAG: hypothetical protein JSV49_03190 [Thermoplasmata archaeon]
MKINQLDRKEKHKFGSDDVLKAIDEFITVNRSSSTIYWNRDEYRKLPEREYERFGKIFDNLKGKGIENAEIGKIIYYIGDEMKLPGFVPNPSIHKKFQ